MVAQLQQKAKVNPSKSDLTQTDDNGEHADDTVSLALASEIKIKSKEANHALAHESKETKDMADEITSDYNKNHLLV